jgi:hypothetical protein
METVRGQLSRFQRVVEGAFLVAGLLAMIGPFFVLHQPVLLRTLSILFPSIMVAFIAYEAVIKRLLWHGLIGVALVPLTLWLQAALHFGLRGLPLWLGAAAIIWILVGRQATDGARAGVEQPTETASAPGTDELLASPTPAASSPKGLGDPDFRYLPPPPA